MHLYVFGYPSDSGGASTELWHLLRLWRGIGIDVTLVPTWNAPRGWQDKTDAIGCKTLLMRPNEVTLPDDSIVVSLCNAPFLAASKKLRNCRLVWVPCMTYMNEPLESETYLRDGPFDAYVFQSQFQRDKLLPELARFGVDPESVGQRRYKRSAVCSVIRGAFSISDFPFNPRHRDGDAFCFGRLSRPDPRKFRADWWRTCNTIREAIGDSVACRTMGWHKIVERKCGRPPAWCETLPKCGEPVSDFYGSLDALVQLGDADENWPRVGLEAMASGVPIVADRRGGWLEMIQDGETGYLVDGPEQASQCLVRLANEEPLRLKIAARARQAAEDMADSSRITEAWKYLFTQIGNTI